MKSKCFTCSTEFRPHPALSDEYCEDCVDEGLNLTRDEWKLLRMGRLKKSLARRVLQLEEEGR